MARASAMAVSARAKFGLYVIGFLNRERNGFKNVLAGCADPHAVSLEILLIALLAGIPDRFLDGLNPPLRFGMFARFLFLEPSFQPTKHGFSFRGFLWFKGQRFQNHSQRLFH